MQQAVQRIIVAIGSPTVEAPCIVLSPILAVHDDVGAAAAEQAANTTDTTTTDSVPPPHVSPISAGKASLNETSATSSEHVAYSTPSPSKASWAERVEDGDGEEAWTEVVSKRQQLNDKKESQQVVQLRRTTRRPARLNL